MVAACVLGRSGLAAGYANELVPDAAGPAGSGAAAAAAAMEGARAAPDFETAMDELLQRGEAGDAAAQWSLGMRYRFGVGVAADMDVAREWLKRGAEAGHAEACRAYGWTFVADRQDKKAIAEAARWMARAAELGNLDAMVEEADLTTTMMNFASMGKKMRAAAEKGSVAAQARYGLFASAGMAAAKDKDAAERFLYLAADSGSTLAAEIAGMNLVIGTRESEASSEDQKRGIAYLRFAAECGRPNAQHYLGSELRRIARDHAGTIAMIGMDSSEGVTWLVKAAEQAHSPSLTRLGGMYLEGDGVPKDVAKGAELIERSGGIGAQFHAVRVGSLYEEGKEVPRDMAAAMKWYRKGADVGDVEAQSALARVLSSGSGVERDLVEAYKWANIAAAKGGANEIAQRDALGAKLSGEEVQEGQSRASSFKPISLMSPAARPKMSPPEFQGVDGVVSGFFVSNDGYLITSSPLLAKARRVRVFAAGKPMDAVVVRYDAESEIALVKIAAETAFVPVAQETDLESGPITVKSFPSPWGEWKDASTREVEVAAPGLAAFTWLQVDARAGNSGGVVLNADGKAIGVMTHRVPMMSEIVPPDMGGDFARLLSAMTPTFGIQRGSALLDGVDLDGTPPADTKAIGPMVIVLIEL